MVIKKIGDYALYNSEDAFINSIKWNVYYDKWGNYIDCYSAFDTESSTYDMEEGYRHSKATITYAFQLGINNSLYIARTGKEFIDLLKRINDIITNLTLGVSKKDSHKLRTPKLIIYVHNLDYDLNFLFNYITDEDITDYFNIKKKTINITLWDNIQFRCMLALTRMSLEALGKEYLPKDNNYLKRSNFDYSKKRNSLTPFDDDELEYMMVDIIGLIEVIKVLEKVHNMRFFNFPVSATAFTKRAVSNHVIGKSPKQCTSEQKAYRNLIKHLTLSLEDLLHAKECYKGGITDVNPRYINKLIKGIGDFDIASEYPYAMVSQKFPMSSPEFVSNPTLDMVFEILNSQNTTKSMGFLSKFKAKNVRIKNHIVIPPFQAYLSTFEETQLYGNRIYEATEVELDLNDVDFRIFLNCYDYEEIEILQLRIFKMDYLPKILVEYILKCFGDKTRFKGVEEEEVQYLLSKVVINSIYGMMAMYPIHPEYELRSGIYYKKDYKQEGDDKYSEDELQKILKERMIEDYKKKLEKHNNSSYRISYYLWGQYVASYGHKFLYDAAELVKEDIIYGDTDSWKVANINKNKIKFEKLNNLIEDFNKSLAKTRDINVELFYPKTKHGEVKTIGVWEWEEDVTEIIAKRAKCYMLKENEDWKLTCAGIAKKAGMKALIKEVEKGKYKDVVDAFIDDISVDGADTGKLTHTYIHDQEPFIAFDDYGNEEYRDELFSIVLQPAPFKFNTRLPDDYLFNVIYHTTEVITA